MPIMIKGQVTIGSSHKANTGALLDIKEESVNDISANASGGLLLPRVQLTKQKPATPAELAASIGTTDESWDMAGHIGLTIYNCIDNSECGMPKGVYVWDGSQWLLQSGEKLTKAPPKGSYNEDVAALKELRDANPKSSLPGRWANPDPTQWQGTIWASVCGEKRLTELYVTSANISLPNGIEKMHSLKFLNCDNNQLTTLNIAGCKVLSGLNCSQNRLTTLDLSAITDLTSLSCSQNYLPTQPQRVLLNCGSLTAPKISSRHWTCQPTRSYSFFIAI